MPHARGMLRLPVLVVPSGYHLMAFTGITPGSASTVPPSPVTGRGPAAPAALGEHLVAGPSQQAGIPRHRLHLP